MSAARELAWYLIYTKPQQERLARENLERQGYTVYLPMLSKNIRRGRRFHARISPLFPRYLFIRLSHRSDDWGPIRSTTGVVHLVKFGEQAVSVPSSLIEAIQSREDADGIYAVPQKPLKKGDTVRFIEGSLSGYEAIFETRTSAERVMVLMDIAGKYTRLSISDRSIEIVDK